MTTLFACFDKYCYELRPVEPLLSLTPVRGTPSGTGFDESRSAKTQEEAWGRNTRIYIRRVYDWWCAAREEAERGKKCSGQNKMMRNTYSCSVLSSPLQRRSYRVSQAFHSHSRSRRVARSRCSDFYHYQAGAAIGLIWCGLGGNGAIFLPQKIDKKSLNSVTVHL